jgi:glucose-6-phosphate 1-dehydrogenase
MEFRRPPHLPLFPAEAATLEPDALAYWQEAPQPIPLYHAATWGPQEAAQLIEKDGRRWHDL